MSKKLTPDVDFLLVDAAQFFSSLASFEKSIEFSVFFVSLISVSDVKLFAFRKNEYSRIIW